MSLQPVIEQILQELSTKAPETPHPFCVAVDTTYIQKRIDFLKKTMALPETLGREEETDLKRDIRKLLKELKDLRAIGEACVIQIGGDVFERPAKPPPEEVVVPPIRPKVPFTTYTKEELDRMRLRTGTPNLAEVCRELTAKGIPCHVSRTKSVTIYSILEAYKMLEGVKEVPKEEPTPPPVKPKPKPIPEPEVPFPLHLDLPIFKEAVQPILLEDIVPPSVLDEYMKAGAITWADVINPSPTILVALTRSPEGKKIKFKETGTLVYTTLRAIAAKLPAAKFPSKKIAQKALVKINATPLDEVDLPRLGKKGSKTRQNLAELGVKTLGDLVALTDEKILSKYTQMPQPEVYKSFREKAKGLQADLLARAREEY